MNGARATLLISRASAGRGSYSPVLVWRRSSEDWLGAVTRDAVSDPGGFIGQRIYPRWTVASATSAICMSSAA